MPSKKTPKPRPSTRRDAEERGGPFVPSTGKKEFAHDTDPSNPPDAEPAAFPTTRSKKRLAPPTN